MSNVDKSPNFFLLVNRLARIQPVLTLRPPQCVFLLDWSHGTARASYIAFGLKTIAMYMYTGFALRQKDQLKQYGRKARVKYPDLKHAIFLAGLLSELVTCPT